MNGSSVFSRRAIRGKLMEIPYTVSFLVVVHHDAVRIASGFYVLTLHVTFIEISVGSQQNKDLLSCMLTLFFYYFTEIFHELLFFLLHCLKVLFF